MKHHGEYARGARGHQARDQDTRAGECRPIPPRSLAKKGGRRPGGDDGHRQPGEGRWIIPVNRSGRTHAVSAVVAARRIRTAGQRRRASRSLRSWTGPAVLRARNEAPCAAKSATTKTSDRQRVPIEDADTAAHAKIGEERNGEVAAGVEGHAADDIAQRHADQAGEKEVGKGEREIPGLPPEGVARWLRASIAMPRTIRHHRSRKKAR